MPRSIYREEEDQSTTMVELSKKNVDEQSENASWKRGHSRDNSLEMRAKQQPIKDDVNDSCSEDIQLKKQWLHRVHTQAMFLMTITSSLRINDFRALLKIQRERVMVMMLLQSWSRLIKDVHV
ncbi:hypothetical protein YC2023_061402 [Brassica napus]